MLKASATPPVEKVQELEFVLTPGRFVGLPDEDDDFNFQERFKTLKKELKEQITEEVKLNEIISENLKNKNE